MIIRYLFFISFCVQVLVGCEQLDLELRRLHRTGSALDKMIISQRHKTSYDEDVQAAFLKLLTYVDTAKDEGFIDVKRSVKKVELRGRNNARIFWIDKRKIMIDAQDGQSFLGSPVVLFVQFVLTYISKQDDIVIVSDSLARSWKFRKVLRSGTSDQSYVVGELG